MKKISIYIILIINVVFYSSNAVSKIVGDKIILGTTFSITGKNSSKNLFYKSQFDKTIKNINSLGGVSVGGKSYQFEIIYYDDMSNTSRANQLLARFILNEGVQFLIVLPNIKLSNLTKNLIKKYKISVVKSYEAVKIYKETFETVNSVNSKKIKDFLINNSRDNLLKNPDVGRLFLGG